MATPEPPHRPFTFSRVLVLIALALAVFAAAVLFYGSGTVSLRDAMGTLFVVLAVYLASLLVP